MTWRLWIILLIIHVVLLLLPVECCARVCLNLWEVTQVGVGQVGGEVGQWFGTRWHKNHYVISMLIGYLHNMVFTNHCRANARILKGVMRVGLLAKGLLIRDLLRLELVILTSEKPTKKLLQIVAEEMPEQIKVGVLTWFSFAVGSHWNRSFAGLKWFLCRVCICQTNSSCFCVLGSDAFGYF